jgi:hypothetical protein
MVASLMHALQTPTPGDPIGRCCLHERVRDISFLHTRTGKKLVHLRQTLNEAQTRAVGGGGSPSSAAVGSSYSQSSPAAGAQSPGSRPYCANIERDSLRSAKYDYGQLSGTALKTFKVARGLEAQQRGGGGASSPPPAHAAGFSAAKLHSSLEQLIAFLDRLVAAPGDVYPSLLVDAAKSILLISDVFTIEAQYTWALNAFVEIYKETGCDDPVTFRHVVTGAAKMLALAPGTAGGNLAELVTKMVVEGLTHRFVSVRVATLHGCIYLADAKVHVVLRAVLPELTELVLRNIVNIDQVQTRVVTPCFAVAIMLVEQFPAEMEALEFVDTVVKVGVAAVGSPATPDAIYHAVVQGLDRLLPSFTLNQKLRARIESVAHQATKAAPALVNSTVGGLQRFSAALGLILTSMYTGPDGDRAGGMILKQGGTSSDAIESVSASCMSQVSAIFHRASVGGACEARVLQYILPELLSDFMDPRQVMNIVIEEFTKLCTSEGASIELIARVVHHSFAIFQMQGQQGIAKEWAILASSNFLRVQPRRRAVATLACLFISVSQELAIRSLLATVIHHASKDEPIENSLFWLPAMVFFLNEDLSEPEIAMFLDFFASVPESPFVELHEMCSTLAGVAGARGAALV